MSENYDFVIVGAGAMGRSSALYLTMQYPKAKCALIEQFDFEHNEGSSHSQIRIIRSAYSHPFYRDLTTEAIDNNWAELQKKFNNTFIVSNPFLAFIQDQRQFLEYQNVANSSKNIKQITIDQVRSEFPSAPRIACTRNVFVDTKAGIIMAERYMKTLIDHLKFIKNIDLYENTEVLSIVNNSKLVTLNIKTKNEVKQITATKVALTCGRWISKLVPAVEKILIPVRQTITFWNMKHPSSYNIGSHPSWFHTKNGVSTYALPNVGDDGIKFGVHEHSPVMEEKFPDEKIFLEKKMEEIKGYMNQYYKGQYESLKKVEKCYYTVTQSQDFLIDWTDQHENILAVSPCSGHGFKMSPIIGQIVADLLEKGQSIPIFEKYRYLTRMFYHLGVNLE